MLVIFNPNEDRVFSRNNSLSKVPMIIADDVNPTDDVEIDMLEDKILIRKSGKEDVEVTSETEWLYIGKSVGLFGSAKSLKSVGELIFCDTCIAFKLKKGAITVHPDLSKPEDVIVVAAGITPEEYPTPYLNEIKWVDVTDLIGLFRYFGDMTETYPLDYMYQIIVSGKDGREATVRIAKLSILDISYGHIANILEKIASRERAKKLKKRMDMLASQSSAPVINTHEDVHESSVGDDEDDEMYNY